MKASHATNEVPQPAAEISNSTIEVPLLATQESFLLRYEMRTHLTWLILAYKVFISWPHLSFPSICFSKPLM